MSVGVPTEFWIHPAGGAYGLRYLSATEGVAPEPLAFALPDELSFDPQDDSSHAEDEVAMLFWPDGTCDESTIQRIVIRRNESEALEIVAVDSGTRYVIRNATEGDTDVYLL